MNNDNVKLAYGVAHPSSANCYVGAVLITDYKGFPLEFRHTDPITPTKIQQVLYGEGLEKYIKVDVIMDSLLKVLSNKTPILMIQDDDLLEYKTDHTAIVRVSSTKSPPLPATGDISKVKESEYLLQTGRSSNPVRLQFSSHFNCEGEQFNSVIETIKEAGKFIDIEEPLERVHKAIELVCSQEA